MNSAPFALTPHRLAQPATKLIPNATANAARMGTGMPLRSATGGCELTHATPAPSNGTTRLNQAAIVKKGRRGFGLLPTSSINHASLAELGNFRQPGPVELT